MALFKTLSAAVYGVDAHLIDVEVDLYASGNPKDSVTVGMPDMAVRESRERIRSALMNSGFGYPNRAYTIDLAPANVRKEGAGFDLPMAIGILGAMLFVFGFLVLALQAWMPLNPGHKTILAPSAILHSAMSFATNTDLQHYSGDQHLSNFSQLFFGFANFFLSAAIGLSALTAMIRAFRSDRSVGNYFLDMWRVVVYMFLPAAFVFAIIFLWQGSPMTLQSAQLATTLEPGSMGLTDKGVAIQQNIVMGPVAALESMKMLGTNGGGFFGMNSAHPYENPTDISNFFNTLAMMIFPFSLVLMFGRMLKRMKHAIVIFSVMLALMAGSSFGRSASTR